MAFAYVYPELWRNYGQKIWKQTEFSVIFSLNIFELFASKQNILEVLLGHIGS